MNTAAPIRVNTSVITELLIACAQQNLHGDQLQRIRSLAGDRSLNWDLLIQTASDHGVIPLLHRGVSRCGIDSIPAEARATLVQRAQGNGKRNLQLLHELLQLIGELQARNVRVMPYKGPLLALHAYGDPSLRQCGDLDILVPKADIAAAREVLESRGYSLTIPMDAQAEAEYVASPHEYDYCYARRDPSAMVELHWQIIGRFFSFAPDPTELWKRASLQQLGGKPVRILDPEDLLLILAAHGTKHFWSRLTWICDIAQFVKTHGANMNWSRLLKRADEFDARGMLLLALTLAHRVLGIQLPEEVTQHASRADQAQAGELEKRLFVDSDHRDSVPKGARMQLTDGGLLQSLLFHVRMRSWSNGVRYMFHRALTPQHVDRSWIRLPRGMGALYYGVRPLRLVTKYGVQPVIQACSRIADQIRDRTRRLGARPTGEKRRQLHALILVVAIRAALYVIPFRILRGLADVAKRQSQGNNKYPVQLIAHDVVAAAQFVPGATCLTQALTAHVLLRRDGFESNLQIGVARDASGTFKAHSWVECDGQIVVGDFAHGPQYVAMTHRHEANAA